MVDKSSGLIFQRFGEEWMIGPQRPLGERYGVRRDIEGFRQIAIEPQLESKKVECLHIRRMGVIRCFLYGDRPVDRRPRAFVSPLALQRPPNRLERAGYAHVRVRKSALLGLQTAFEDSQCLIVATGVGHGDPKKIERTRNVNRGFIALLKQVQRPTSYLNRSAVQLARDEQGLAEILQGRNRDRCGSHQGGAL